jgi:hypothetical protein
VGFTLFAHQQIEGLTYDSYNNAKNTYNYTFWNSNWKKGGITDRLFTNYTSSYKLAINYTKLNIASLNVNQDNTTPSNAFQNSYKATFPVSQPGDIDVKILQNGAVLYQLNKTRPTNASKVIGQMVNYGTWYNRRVIDSLNYTPQAPVVGTHTGVEFTNWHNRFRIAYQFRPRSTINNAQLQLSIQMPEAFDTIYYANGVYGFGKSPNGEGFAVKGGVTTDSISVCGSTITVFTKQQNLIANTQYQLGLIFYPVKENLCKTFEGVLDDVGEVTVTASQTKPDKYGHVSISYSKDDGLYYVGIPEYKMGYNSESTIDVMQNINMEIENTNDYDKRVRLCFNEDAPKNVVGFSSMLRNPNGDPSGLPLQITKNWHTTPRLYSGSWVKEYTEVIVPANSTLKFDYTRVGARWGKVFAAFSHQLCVVGAGVPRGGWLEAGLGSFGENITFSPDIEYGNANVCDYCPFLCTNQYYGGTSKEYGWTGNLGGMNLFNYDNASGETDYQSQVKTRFKKYGPNLTETSISTYSSDEKLKMDYTYQLNRSDDFLRIYFKIKVKALEVVPFSRFDFFQMGHDTYRNFRARSVAYGNSGGVVGEFTPASGKEGYTTAPIALTGEDPWVWGGDAVRVTTDSDYGTMNIDANNSFIIRSYKASFSGKENNTPYFRERTSFYKEQYPTSYCLVPPPGITQFAQGDSVEMILEVCLTPKVDEVYYGPNVNFKKALTAYGNQWELLYREVVGNKINARSATNEINLGYPLTVKTENNTASVTITGGVGYIPIVFSNLTSIEDPKLYLVTDDGDVLIDQSNYGKDFWQAEYDVETGLYELIYNLNHDTDEDTLGIFKYRLEAAPSDGPNASNFALPIPEVDIAAREYLNTTTICHTPESKENIALLGLASQSSTIYGAEASRAIDGNTSGQWIDNSLTYTDTENNPWWQVDLGNESVIGEIKLYNRTDCCEDRLGNFTVSVINAENDTTFSQSFTSQPNPMLSVNAGGVKGQIIKVQIKGMSTLTLAEVEVFNFPYEVGFNVVDASTNENLYGVLLDVNNHLYATNGHGFVMASLPGNANVLSLSKGGYHTHSQSLNVAKDTSLTIAMAAKIKVDFSLKVTDSGNGEVLPDVTIIIGDSIFTTNENGMLACALWEGEYELTLEKDRYFALSQDLNLESSGSLELEMTKSLNTILFEVKDKSTSAPVEDAIIIINNIGYKSDEIGMVTFLLARGEHSYYIFKDGYMSLEDTIVVTGDAIVTILLSTPVAVKDVEKAALNVYPNPANNNIIIQSDKAIKNKVQLFDLNGLDLTWKISVLENSSVKEVNVANVPNGMYILKVDEQHTVIQIQK